MPELVGNFLLLSLLPHNMDRAVINVHGGGEGVEGRGGVLFFVSPQACKLCNLPDAGILLHKRIAPSKQLKAAP